MERSAESRFLFNAPQIAESPLEIFKRAVFVPGSQFVTEPDPEFKRFFFVLIYSLFLTP